jgi:nucleoside-diphosphate-sugar epimerase
MAGLDHEVADVAPSDDPELAQVFGPTLVAIAKKWEEETPERQRLEDTKTYKRLGYSPRSLDDGLAPTLEWLRALGKVDAA